jgi:hypothetical protein
VEGAEPVAEEAAPPREAAAVEADGAGRGTAGEGEAGEAALNRGSRTDYSNAHLMLPSKQVSSPDRLSDVANVITKTSDATHRIDILCVIPPNFYRS